jgi:hypothetical protein
LFWIAQWLRQESNSLVTAASAYKSLRWHARMLACQMVKSELNNYFVMEQALNGFLILSGVTRYKIDSVHCNYQKLYFWQLS